MRAADGRAGPRDDRGPAPLGTPLHGRRTRRAAAAALQLQRSGALLLEPSASEGSGREAHGESAADCHSGNAAERLPARGVPRGSRRQAAARCALHDYPPHPAGASGLRERLRRTGVAETAASFCCMSPPRGVGALALKAIAPLFRESYVSAVSLPL